jgi:hypothetical protein
MCRTVFLSPVSFLHLSIRLFAICYCYLAILPHHIHLDRYSVTDRIGFKSPEATSVIWEVLNITDRSR